MMNWPYWGEFLKGVLLTLEVTAISFIGALILGVLLVAMRVSGLPPFRIASAVYVEIGRNVPILALLFLMVYGFPQLGVDITLFWSAVIVLAVYEGAFICEALRAGVNTVDRGATEAARALGFTTLQTLIDIVIPQAMRSVVQPLGNVFIKTALNSSIIAVVGLADITGVTQNINLREAQPALFFAAGFVYVAIALAGGLLAGRIDAKVRFSR